jgi:uncharacterized protein (TIGR04255 family)
VSGRWLNAGLTTSSEDSVGPAGRYDLSIEVSAATGTSAIVDADDPPVIEVALAIQFESPQVDLLDVAALAKRVKADLPHHEEQPPLAPMGETFGRPSAADSIEVEVIDRPPMPRFWFISEDRVRLLQIQHDRIAFNWRQLGPADDYPRYGHLRERLERCIEALESVLSEQGKERLRTNWCEVAYVNHIEPIDGQRLPLAEILQHVSRPSRDTESSFLPEPEDFSVRQRYLITEGDEPIGRFITSVDPAVRRLDGAEIWVLNLVSRLRTDQPTVQDALSRLDLGRLWAVNGFQELTTPRMHEQWGLRGAQG